MDAIERIAEQRIREALERGEFDRLRGTGKPLDLDDDANVPVELRVAFRILKNSGFLPPEIELRREIANAEQLLTQALTPVDRERANRRLEFLLVKLAVSRGGRDSHVEAAYYARLAEKLEPTSKLLRDAISRFGGARNPHLSHINCGSCAPQNTTSRRS